MQVKFGDKVFNKTKFSALDGRTTVTFESEDGTMQSRADMELFKFELNFEGREHAELQAQVHSFGMLMDETYKEHAILRKSVQKKIMGID